MSPLLTLTDIDGRDNDIKFPWKYNKRKLLFVWEEIRDRPARRQHLDKIPEGLESSSESGTIVEEDWRKGKFGLWWCAKETQGRVE